MDACSVSEEEDNSLHDDCVSSQTLHGFNRRFGCRQTIEAHDDEHIHTHTHTHTHTLELKMQFPPSPPNC